MAKKPVKPNTNVEMFDIASIMPIEDAAPARHKMEDLVGVVIVITSAEFVTMATGGKFVSMLGYFADSMEKFEITTFSKPVLRQVEKIEDNMAYPVAAKIIMHNDQLVLGSAKQ